MLTIVLVVNGLIGLGCLLVAWQLWRLKNRLARAADTLTAVERSVHRVLHRAPHNIIKGQSNTYHLRYNLKHLEPQIQQLQQIMALLSLGQRIWRRQFGPFPLTKGGRRATLKLF